MSKHKRKAAAFLFTGFAFAVLAISATTSFSFFYNHFGALLPAGLLDDKISRLISGLVGMLLFDVATAIWLYTFLNHAETSEQRAISLLMATLAFIGAAAASVAHLGLTATGELALDPATKETIAVMALITVIVGVIANFGAAQAYQRFSLESKAAVREADRRDAIQEAEDEQAAYLDGLIAQQVKEQLTAVAPNLAQQQAARIASRFYRQEDAKYADDDTVTVNGHKEDGRRRPFEGRGEDVTVFPLPPGVAPARLRPIDRGERRRAAAEGQDAGGGDGDRPFQNSRGV